MIQKETPPTSPYMDQHVEELEDNDLELIENGDVEVLDNYEVEEIEEIEDDEDQMGEPHENVEQMEREDASCIFDKHTASVFTGSLSKDGNYAVTGGEDDKAYVWNSRTGEVVVECSEHNDSVVFADFSHDDVYLATGDMNGIIKVRKTSDNQIIWDYDMGDALWMQWHPHAHVLLAGSVAGEVYMWRIPSGECKIIQGFGKKPDVASLMPDEMENVLSLHQMIILHEFLKLRFARIFFYVLRFGTNEIKEPWLRRPEDPGNSLWDLRAGRQLREFSNHTGPATCVEFHPHEFLLASGGADRVVHFWDLESFQLVSSTDQANSAPIRSIFFSHGGECLFAGCQDVMKVYGWEPARTFDTIPVGWGKIQDIAIAQNQLIGAGFHAASVVLYVCDLKKIAPLGSSSGTGETSPSPFSYGNSLRKSFSKERPASLKKHTMEVKTIEEDKSGTDPEEEEANFDIPNVSEYRDVFQPTRSHEMSEHASCARYVSVTRTPPPEPEAFPEPPEEPEIQHQQPSPMVRSLSNSMSSLLSADAEDNENNLSSTSPPTSTNSVSMPKPTSVRVQPIKQTPLIQRSPIPPISSTSQIRATLQANSKNSKNLAPVPPLRHQGQNSNLVKRSSPMPPPKPLGPQRSNTTLTPRNAPMAAVSPVMDDGKLKSRANSPDYPKQLIKRGKDNGESYDSDFPVKHFKIISSDVCACAVLLLVYVTVGCSALRIILRNFGPVIKSNVDAPLHTIGVDMDSDHYCSNCTKKLLHFTVLGCYACLLYSYVTFGCSAQENIAKFG
ncbi:unnamed protein product [Trichogramma brassicae]|uniref:Katanin p80 subunit C-terminal domain-containing protein n=1 Tax=Trichogramma brassicae TaxID=86971 RepID=A0A6H5I814_9HYME|nr:unnamed protein product [Trichogramma brassicae]